MLPTSLQLFCWQASALFLSSVLYCTVPIMAAREDISWNGIFWDHSYTEVLGAVSLVVIMVLSMDVVTGGFVPKVLRKNKSRITCQALRISIHFSIITMFHIQMVQSK